jgi:hypothetical protein
MQATFKTAERELTFSELTFDDWMSLQKYIQYRDYYQLKKDAEKIPEVAELLPEVLRECAKKQVDLSAVSEAVNVGAFDVIIELVWLSASKYHKELTRDELQKALSNDNLQEALGLIMGLCGIDNDEEDSSKNPETGAV